MSGSREVADTSQWLHNKLGSTDDLWSGSSICSQISTDKLHSIMECFSNLQPHVKVKLLLSIVHLPKRGIEQFKRELDSILQMAQEDADQWVGIVGDILKSFPSSGALCTDVDDGLTFFHEVVNELRKIVKKSHDVIMLPMECPYLCRSAISSIGGQIPTAGKYFTLRRKPKSAALRAEVLQKSTEAANNLKRNSGTTVPVKIRSFAKEMDDTTPLRGIPSDRALTTGGFMRSSTISGRFGSSLAVTQKNTNVQKEGGIKLLDITEQPLGSKEAKKRKRLAEQEVSEKRKKEVPLVTTASLMPEYACGLLAQSLDQNLSEPVVSTVVTPSLTYLPPESSVTSALNTVTISRTQTDLLSTASSIMPTFASVGSTPNSSINQPTTLSMPQNKVRFQIQMQGGLAILRPTLGPIQSPLAPTSVPAASPVTLQAPGGGQTLTFQRPNTPSSIRLLLDQSSLIQPISLLQNTGQHQLQQHTLITQQQQAQHSLASNQLYHSIASVPKPPNAAQLITLGQVGMTGGLTTGMVVSAANAIKTLNPSDINSDGNKTTHLETDDQQQRKPSLQLTKEQMVEAQEMFRVSNKVTRPEKALILGFMAGSRENPVPNQGDIVNIRLSESSESVKQIDGSFKPMTVETYFQMNYATGEWKRVRKVRELEPDID